MIQRPLKYVDRLQSRERADIGRVVIHATELPDLATAREYGERLRYAQSGTGNSGHFYIDRNGQIEQWVPIDRVAHHVRAHNADSIGIELVNRGRWPHWLDSRSQDWPENYPETQIQALIALLMQLRDELPALAEIAGHDQLDVEWVEASDDATRKVRRKTDPGPGFPWPQLLQATGLKRAGHE
ncbi:MAG: N-acetylmuramoyl-L-alanine amidase [Wenzhouxiangellaceae bacterium]|nr:N-acetylmuramoyl-L-alanine amidase [Wenzhouxiangellaceae bacterium]